MRVTIDPITRLEGHGKIEIFLDEAGDVRNAYLQIPELRGFEKFCEGRPVEELPRIVPKICGVCPEAHHMASVKACDAVFAVDPPPAAKKLRELFYCAHQIHSHIAHFYALAGPDFVLGPDAPPESRNILGVIGKVGLDAGKSVIKHRSYAQKIQTIIGGRATQPVCGLPGGVSKALAETDRREIETMAASCVEFGRFTMNLFDDLVLKNKAYLDLVASKDHYHHVTHYMGLVDEKNRLNFYDGMLRVVDTTGKELLKFAPADYREHMAERVEPWSYMKFVHLKAKGWKGLVDGQDSGVYRVAPLGRINVAESLSTPLAQAELEKMRATLGRPVHHTLGMHWARVIEILHAAERMHELSIDPEITSPEVRRIPTAAPREGVGVVEAPRGTLLHHYTTDERGIVRTANMIVATGNNYAAMCMSVKKAAQAFIKGGKVEEGLLNRVEMAFRAYDPCMSCATHALPGAAPLLVNIRDAAGDIVRTIRRD